MKKSLDEEYNEYMINSIYEETSAGEYLESIAYQVENEMGLYVEPSVQMGGGIVTIFNESGDEIYADGIDFDEYCEDIVKCMLESNSRSQCVSKLRQLYQSYLKNYKYEEDD